MTRPVQEIPRTGLTIDEAAASIGVSPSHFRRHVLPHVKTSKVGARRIVALRELDRFLEDNARRTLVGEAA